MHKANHSPPFCAEVQNIWSFIYILMYACMYVCCGCINTRTTLAFLFFNIMIKERCIFVFCLPNKKSVNFSFTNIINGGNFLTFISQYYYEERGKLFHLPLVQKKMVYILFISMKENKLGKFQNDLHASS
jgi:hypothetical protein